MKNKRDFYDGKNAPAERAPLPKRWFFSRILCFLVALGIWIYVVNVTTQDTEKTFNLIDINVEGLEELQEATNMSLVDLEESKVSITVKGLRSDIGNLSEKDFSAYVDISKLKEVGKHDLEVSVNLPSTVSLVSRYPETVTVSVDKSVERDIALEIALTEYNMENIYEMGTPSADVNSVHVIGPSDVLNRVRSAKAYINLGTVMTSTVIRTEIVLVDKAGNSIDTTFLTMDNTSVTVTVPVTMQKTVSLVCDFASGADRSDYKSIQMTPSSIRVKGDPKILNDLDSITVYTLDGTDKQTVSVDFASISLPGGVTAIDPPKVIRIIASLVEDTTEPEDTTVDPPATTAPAETTEAPADITEDETTDEETTDQV